MSTGYTAEALRAALTRLDEIEAIFEECDYNEMEVIKPLQRLSVRIQAELSLIERGMRSEWQAGPALNDTATP